MTVETRAGTLASFDTGTVEADGFSIRYFRRGTGDAFAVIHGGGGPIDYANGPALELLTEKRQVIAFELPGFGDSEPNTKTQNAQEMAATLAAAMKELDVDTYTVLGTSMGAVVALWWAVDFPDRVTSAVLESPAVFRSTPPPSNLAEDPEAFMRAFHAKPERKPWLADFKPGPPAGRELMLKLMGSGNDEALVERLSTLEAPVLVLMGTKDGVISTDEGRTYKQTIPTAFVIMVYNAAHDLKGDRPEAFAHVVDDFLTYGGNFILNHESGLLNP